MSGRISDHGILLCTGLTLELSRPVAGRRACASVAHSTWPTPRHGVGLNELLGGGGCRCEPSPSGLAERRSGKARTRTRELSAGCNRSDRIRPGRAGRASHRFRSRPTQRMQCVSAFCGLGRSGNVLARYPKSIAKRSRQNHRAAKQNCETLFCRLTPELSRPAAGRRTRASVAQARDRCHDAGSA